MSARGWDSAFPRGKDRLRSSHIGKKIGKTFLDGNGRVMRLFTHAWLVRTQVAGHGLWMVSRGLARRQDDYLRELQAADEPRRGDLDGRGNLSDEGLADFCKFFLETALDQVRFMAGLLELDGVLLRVSKYVELRAARSSLAPEARFLLQEVLLRGEVARGEVSRITGLGERTGRTLLSQLTAEGLLWSATPKGALRFGFPPSAVPYYFPRLYPAQIEASLVGGTAD
jgi:Fic family protein